MDRQMDYYIHQVLNTILLHTKFRNPVMHETPNCRLLFLVICDLLGEKGPTAVKRRFKTQSTAFSL